MVVRARQASGRFAAAGGSGPWWDKENLIDFYAAWAWKEGLRVFVRGRASRRRGSRGLVCRRTVVGNFPAASAAVRGQPISRWHQSAASGHSDGFGSLKSSRTAPGCISMFPRPGSVDRQPLRQLAQDWRRAEKRLPATGERSWHVEVFDRQSWVVRHSRETSRWFQGKHSVHIQGNRQNARRLHSELPSYPKYKPSGVEWLGDVPEQSR